MIFFLFSPQLIFEILKFTPRPGGLLKESDLSVTKTKVTPGFSQERTKFFFFDHNNPDQVVWSRGDSVEDLLRKVRRAHWVGGRTGRQATKESGSTRRSRGP